MAKIYHIQHQETEFRKVKFHFDSNFPRRFWGFAAGLERDQMKQKKCAKRRTRICFILHVQRAGVVIKTNIYILKAFDRVDVSFGKNRVMRFTLNKWFDKTFLSSFDN